MTHKMASLLAVALTTSALAVGPPARAQNTSRSANSSDYSLLPYTRSGYVGLDLGGTRFKTSCGANPALPCDDSDGAVHLYTGGMGNPYWGVELGYVHVGEAQRGGGDSRAQGLHASLVGRLPLSDKFSLHAKVGALYGRTNTSAAPSSAIPTGSDSGWGGTYAIGAALDISTNWSVLMEQARYNFHFAGVGREAVDTVSLGVKYRF